MKLRSVIVGISAGGHNHLIRFNPFDSKQVRQAVQITSEWGLRDDIAEVDCEDAVLLRHNILEAVRLVGGAA
jgi:hypothetical protein